jgi:hypothetical protein
MSNRTSAYSIPPARKVSPLRQRMIDDMTVRNLAPNTMLCYLKQVNYLARYFWQVATAVRPGRDSGIPAYLGHRSLATTARYLYLTTSTVCAVTSPLDLLPCPVSDSQR